MQIRIYLKSKYTENIEHLYLNSRYIHIIFISLSEASINRRLYFRSKINPKQSEIATN